MLPHGFLANFLLCFSVFSSGNDNNLRNIGSHIFRLDWTHSRTRKSLTTEIGFWLWSWIETYRIFWFIMIISFALLYINFNGAIVLSWLDNLCLQVGSVWMLEMNWLALQTLEACLCLTSVYPLIVLGYLCETMDMLLLQC